MDRKFEQGSAILATLALTTMMGLFVMSALAMASIINTNRVGSSLTFVLSLISSNTRATLNNEGAWQQTLQNPNNSSLICLRTHATCPITGGTFSLYDAAGKIMYDSIDPKSGFTQAGSPCTSFGTSGNENCLYRVELTWRPNCGSDCKDPNEIILVTKFLRSKKAPGTINVKKYDFEVTRRNLSSGKF